MKRKVNRVGQNTLTVSLPSKWAKNLDIKAGEEVEVEEDANKLIITRNNYSKKTLKATINIDDFNKLMLNRHLYELYRQGAEEIVIKFSKETLLDYKYDREIDITRYINKIIERFIGMEVISQSKNKIIIESLIPKEEYKKADMVLNRMYFLIKEFLNEFINAMDNDFEKFHNKSYEYHDNIAKFTYYYTRLLTFSQFSEGKKTRLFSLIIIIDKIIDKVRHTSERVHEMKNITKHIKNVLSDIFEIFLGQFDFILKKNYSYKEMDAFVKKRYDLVKKVNEEKFSEGEFKIISECKILLDTINDFTETFVALHIGDFLDETVNI